MQLKSTVTDVLDERLKGDVIVQGFAAVVGKQIQIIVLVQQV